MRVAADECISPIIVDWLRSQGHDVLHILETHRSAKDDFILALAAAENRVLLTEDNDYGDLIFRGNAPPVAGVILLRMLDAPTSERLRRLQVVLHELGERVLGNHVVIGPERTRIRKLP